MGQVRNHENITDYASRPFTSLLYLERNSPHGWFFQYLQLKHAIQAQFPMTVTITPCVIERILSTLRVVRNPSSIYFRITCGKTDRDPLLFHCRWDDIPTEEWDAGVQQYTVHSQLSLPGIDSYSLSSFIGLTTPLNISPGYILQTQRRVLNVSRQWGYISMSSGNVRSFRISGRQWHWKFMQSLIFL